MGFRKPYEVKRKADGSYVKGKWVDGIESSVTIQASVQPINSDEIQYLPEGRRSGKSFKIFTSTELYAAEQFKGESPGRQPDVIIIFEKRYEIVRVMPHQSGVINHYKCYAVEEVEGE
ncbi:hypothetical protein [Anaerosolibacter sp.]|uniref:hypothetical protein n=1 Tax=Anaerosolibacter sp. TaxID=1872527 RepID=UPI0039EF3BE6